MERIYHRHESRHASSCHILHIHYILGHLSLKNVSILRSLGRHPETPWVTPGSHPELLSGHLDFGLPIRCIGCNHSSDRDGGNAAFDQRQVHIALHHVIVPCRWYFLEGFLGKNSDIHPRFHPNSWPSKSGVSEIIFTVYCCPQNSFQKKKESEILWKIFENICVTGSFPQKPFLFYSVFGSLLTVPFLGGGGGGPAGGSRRVKRPVVYAWLWTARHLHLLPHFSQVSWRKSAWGVIGDEISYPVMWGLFHIDHKQTIIRSLKRTTRIQCKVRPFFFRDSPEFWIIMG